MNKFSLWLAGLVGLVLATTAGAVNVTLNGTTKNVANISITHTQSGIQITSSDLVFAGGGGTPTDPVDPGPVDPGPVDPGPIDPGPVDPPPGSAACVESSTQVCGPAINWSNPGGRINSGVVGTNTTISWQFTTNSSSTYSGGVSISEIVGFELVNRRIWISTTPGGEPVSPDYRCAAEGNSARNILWSQQPNRFRCALQPNTTYFLNVKNTSGCSATRSCGFYRSFTTG